MPSTRQAARLANAIALNGTPEPGSSTATTSSSSNGQATSTAAHTPQAAANSGHRHGAIRSASATPAAAAHNPTALQPVKKIRSKPGRPNAGAPATAHQTRTDP